MSLSDKRSLALASTANGICDSSIVFAGFTDSAVEVVNLAEHEAGELSSELAP